METNRSVLTKILATVGPACDGLDEVGELIDEGVRAFRINFSHGSLEDHTQRLRAVREAANAREQPIAVLGDLRGPKLRLRGMADGPIDVRRGDRVEFTRLERPGQRFDDTGVTLLSVTYPPFVEEVGIGHRVLIDDGAVRMLALEKTDVPGEGVRVVCGVTHGGTVKENKGVNLPDSELSIPSLTDFDLRCVEWAIENELDYLALSFVRKAADVELLRRRIVELGGGAPEPRGESRLGVPIVAKLETPQSIDDLEKILEVSDAVMVARGDLGVEMDLAEVPVLQKRIIENAHHHGKPVIVATQMLQSMIQESSPTRAEVSDVANAILDGADAVMLSGETAVGAYPLSTVRMMAHTAEMTEAYAAGGRREGTRAPRHLRTSRYRTAALAHGVSVIVNDLRAKYVVLWSELGGGARYLSQNRLTVPVITISSNPVALRRMSLLCGIVPVFMERPDSSESFIESIDALMQSKQWAQPGDPVVVVKGEPLGIPGVTNQIRIHYVGDVARVRWRPKSPSPETFTDGLSI